jgi:hypothetical protein
MKPASSQLYTTSRRPNLTITISRFNMPSKLRPTAPPWYPYYHQHALRNNHHASQLFVPEQYSHQYQQAPRKDHYASQLFAPGQYAWHNQHTVHNDHYTSQVFTSEQNQPLYVYPQVLGVYIGDQFHAQQIQYLYSHYPPPPPLPSLVQHMWPGPGTFNPFPIQQYGMGDQGRGRYIQSRTNGNHGTMRFNQGRNGYGNKRGGKKQQQQRNGGESNMAVEEQKGNKQLEEHAPDTNQAETDA